MSRAWCRRLGRLLIVCMLALHIFFLWSIRGLIQRGYADFTVYYTAARMLREGLAGQLYSPGAQLRVQQEFIATRDLRHVPLPYIHPPFEALIFLPLTLLPYTAAYMVWNCINLGMLFWICVMLRRSLVSLREIPLPDCFFACLAFYPIMANFHQGQDAILLLLVTVLAFCALGRQADFSAGLWLGMGVFKFQFLIPIALVLVFWRGKKLVKGFTVTGAAALLASIALVGPREALQYPGYAWRVVSTVHLGGLPYGLMPNLTGLINGWPILEGVGWPLRIVASVASMTLLVMIASMKRWAQQAPFFNLCLACAVIAAVTVSYNTNSYDLSLLVLTIALVLDHCLSSANSRRSLRVLFLPALPLFISPLWLLLWLGWGRTNVMAVSLLWWCYAIWDEMRRIKTTDHAGLASPAAYGPISSQNPQAMIHPRTTRVSIDKL
jgi:hypothetical protein